MAESKPAVLPLDDTPIFIWEYRNFSALFQEPRPQAWQHGKIPRKTEEFKDLPEQNSSETNFNAKKC